MRKFYKIYLILFIIATIAAVGYLLHNIIHFGFHQALDLSIGSLIVSICGLYVGISRKNWALWVMGLYALYSLFFLPQPFKSPAVALWNYLKEGYFWTGISFFSSIVFPWVTLFGVVCSIISLIKKPQNESLSEDF